MNGEKKENQPVFIDIKEIIRAKNPRLAGLIPGFVYSYLKRKLHLGEINSFLKINKDVQGIGFVRKVIELFDISYYCNGLEKIPQGKKYFFISNHPQGAIDSMCLTDVVYKNFGEARFMVNDVLLNLRNFEPIFVPINIFGSQSRQSLLKFEEVFTCNYNILFYPAGLVSRRKNGVIADTEWKKSFINLAIKYKIDIVPVFIDAKNSGFFYRVAALRKFLGLKSNIEMFYLPDEMYKQSGKKITLNFGEPVQYTTFDKSKNHAFWANFIREKVYALKPE